MTPKRRKRAYKARGRGQYTGAACPVCRSRKRFVSNRNCVKCGLRKLSRVKEGREEFFMEKDRLRMAEKRKKKPGVVRDANRAYVLRKFYNMTPEDFEAIREYQKAHPQLRLLLNRDNTTRRESVEHRHSDGLIRGVMHGLTNKAYGMLEAVHPTNTADVLRALAEFHERPPAITALKGNVYGLIGKAQHKKTMRYGPAGTKEPVSRG